MRERSGPRICRLLEQSQRDLMSQLLSEQRLVQLLGPRILELDSEFGGKVFRRQVATATYDAMQRARVIEILAAHIGHRLAQRAIRMLPLKGPFLSRRLYGEPWFRSTNDLDILVDPSKVEEAVEAVAGMGFQAGAQPGDQDEIHQVLRHPRGRLPRVEVHWRVHWYEDRFSAGMLARAEPEGEWLSARADDELAALLLFYARDGFYGLRTAADLAAWWDRYGSQDTSEPVLASHVRDFPKLREALVTGARVAERVVGLPAAAIVPTDGRPRPTERLAARLANWNQVGEVDQLTANIALVDGLLGSRSQLGAFIRRRIWIGRTEIAAIYDLDDPDGIRARAWQIAHAPKLCLRFLLGLAGFRGSATDRPLTEPTHVSRDLS